jgi:hypothetical protein
MKRTAVPILLILTLAALLSACGQPSSAEAKDTFCGTLPQLNASALKVKAINPNTSIEQAKEYGNELQAAWADTKSAAADVHEAQVDALQEAYDEMIREINAISDEEAIAGAQAQIEASVQKFEAAHQAITTTVCP